MHTLSYATVLQMTSIARPVPPMAPIISPTWSELPYHHFNTVEVQERRGEALPVIGDDEIVFKGEAWRQYERHQSNNGRPDAVREADLRAAGQR